MPSQDCLQLHLQGDSEMIINWINGSASVKDQKHLSNVHAVRKALAHLWGNQRVIPAPNMGHWAMHQYRDHNKIADKLATCAILNQKALWVHRPTPPATVALWAGFDGGLRKGISGAGWWLAAGV